MKLLDVFSIINDSKFLIERDVFNAKEIKQWVNDSAERLQDPHTRTWYASQLFKFLINRYEDGLRTAQFDANAPDWVLAKLDAGEQIFTIEVQQELRQQAEGVIDWLNAQTAENTSPNLRMTWEDAVEAQAEWHKDIARQSRVTELTAEQMQGIVTLMEFDDGYKWVDVQTEVCLKHEGTLMGHCVGAGGYTQGVKEGTTKILSLRDSNNNPHATIQGDSKNPIIITAEMVTGGQLDLYADNAVEKSFVGMIITQIKGKENKAVVRKYRDYVQEFLTKFGIEKFSDYGLHDLENSGLFKLHDYGFKSIEEAGQEVIKMEDSTSWHRVNNDEVVLGDYSGPVAAKWFLYDKSGRSIGGLVEREEGTINSIDFPYGKSMKPYKEHIQKVFDTGVRPDEMLYRNWDSALNKMGLGVNNGKVGHPNVVGKLKGKTTAGELYATEGSSGDSYWVINGDNIQSQFRLNNTVDTGTSIYFDPAYGLPNGAMTKFLKQFEATFESGKIRITHIIVQGSRTILVNDMEWKPSKDDELLLEEDGVKFYSSGESIQGSTWYNAVDSIGHHIFNMSVGDTIFNVRMVNDYKVAGYYAVYLLEYLETEEDVDIGAYTNYASFARVLLDETGWFQSDYSRGMTQLSTAQNVWMVMDEDYPIHFTETHSYDDDTEEDVYDEDTTMSMYWETTGLQDSGMEIDYFAGEYDHVYAGHSIGYDDEHDGYGEDHAGPEHVRTDYYVNDIGDEKTVMHPASGGSMRISL